MKFNEIEVPNFEILESKNRYSGSYKDKNYKIFPSDELRAVIWDGINCLEKSEIVAEGRFEMNKEGYTEMLNWIYSHCTGGKS